MAFRFLALILAAATAIVFIAQGIIPGLTDSLVLVSGEAAGRPWILVTSIFLHGSLSHLLGNMFALVVFGIVLENIIGSKKFAALYLASGVIASMVSTNFYASALGASGAIFGVLGALAAIRPRLIVWTYGVPMPMVAATAFWFLLDIAGTFYPSSTANMAHIAGLLFGVFVGFVVLSKYRERFKKSKGRRTQLVSDKEFIEWEDGRM